MRDTSKMIGNPVDDSLSNAAAAASSGDYASAIIACAAAISSAYSAESSLAQQPQMSAITNAQSSIQASLSAAQSCSALTPAGQAIDSACPGASDYQSALAWAQAARDAVMADSQLNGNNPVNPPTPASTLQNLAQNAVDAINADSAYCTSVSRSGSAVNTAVHAFKAGWNASGQGSNLPYNGQYDSACAAAITTVLGSAPQACGAPVPPPAQTVTCSDGSVHPAGFVCPPAAPLATTSGMPMWLKVTLGVLAAAAVVFAGVMIYRRSKKDTGGAAEASETARKPKKKGGKGKKKKKKKSKGKGKSK